MNTLVAVFARAGQTGGMARPAPVLSVVLVVASRARVHAGAICNAHTRTHVDTHAETHTHTRTHAETHTHAHVDTDADTHMHTRGDTQTHAHEGTCRHTHTHTHTTHTHRGLFVTALTWNIVPVQTVMVSFSV